MMTQREAKVAQFAAEGIALKEKERLRSECNTDASLSELFNNEDEFLFRNTSLLSDNSSNGDEHTSDSESESTESSSVGEGGFW